ncbi:MAG: hypothetical protein J3K34DRAFT_406835 [Monoraphidium minutum]|nr:MAG: hypothetical protein J3K34DRAFT_406835 [Monoraphidium minutum]
MRYIDRLRCSIWALCLCMQAGAWRRGGPVSRGVEGGGVCKMRPGAGRRGAVVRAWARASSVQKAARGGPAAGALGRQQALVCWSRRGRAGSLMLVGRRV